ncbi:hypothetical protein ACEQ8H_001330 [Pleosporales sp. CAS-2024a]
MSRANQWFVPGDGIAREVITADIQRYLGPDALVRPGVGNGEYQGQPGYWITAYRTLTSQMIQDLKMDSQRWQQERQPGEAGRGGSHSPYLRDTTASRGPDASLVAYQDSRTHAARQHWGPSKPFDQPTEPAYEQPPRQSTSSSSSSSRATYSSPSYATSAAHDTHYTTTPTAPSYASSHSPYSVTPASAAPRTQPADPYSTYQQPAAAAAAARDAYPQSSYSSYSTQSQSDPYAHGRSATSTAGPYATPRYFGYFDEHYLVYR